MTSTTNGRQKPDTGQGLSGQLILIFILFLVGMSLYQWLKYSIYPNITLVQSNVATILFTSLAGTILAWLAVRRQNMLYTRAVAEVERRKAVEEELKGIQLELEERIEERTTELVNTNHLLESEIVERQKTQHEMKIKEEKYRTFLELAPVSIISFDENGVVLFVNDYHIRTFARGKYDQSHFVGMNIVELPAIAGAGLSDEMYRLLEGEPIELTDVWTPQFSGGRSGYFNLRGVPVVKDGYMAGGILITEDVTARWNTENELRKLNRALETIRSCHKALLHADGETALLEDVCRAMVETGGYGLAWAGLALHDERKTVRPAAWAGTNDEYVTGLKVTWADEPTGQGPAGTAIRTRKPVVVKNIPTDPRFAYWRSDALSHGFVSAFSLPLIVNDEPIGALTVLARDYGTFDVEEIELLQSLVADVAHGIGVIRMRADRQKAHEEMRRLEKQLQQSQKLEAIGTLAGGIAHDFNNILGAILGYTQLALLKPDDARAGEYMEQVLQATHRASELVRQILTFSRMKEQDLAPLEIAPVVKEVLKLLRASLPASMEIEDRLTSAPLTVMADPIQIHRIVMNLCANAAQAMGEQGGRLTVSLDEAEVDPESWAPHFNPAPGRYARLSVGDTGAGMSPEVRERIFEPYFTTKQTGEGSGMGLASVHGIVKIHRGAINCQSAPGQGTVFEVYLPIIENKTPAAKPSFGVMPTGKESILLVDDEKPLTEAMAGLLTRLGYRVEFLNSPQEAVDLVGQNPERFDLVITDYTMPQMTGVELTRLLKAIRPDLPVLLFTGYSPAVIPEQAEKAGIRSIIQKPVPLQDLARKVRDVLDGRQTFGVVAVENPSPEPAKAAARNT